MSDLLVVLSVIGAGALLFIALGIRSDYKETRRSKDELITSWEKYYEKSQEYKPIESFAITYANGTFAITYANGTFENVKGVKFTIDEDYVIIFDEYERIVFYANKAELRSFRTERSDYVFKGPKEKGSR